MPVQADVETFAGAGTSANLLNDTLYSSVPMGTIFSLYASTSGMVGQAQASFQTAMGVVCDGANVNVQSAAGILRVPEDVVFRGEIGGGACVLRFTAAAAINVIWSLDITLP